MGRHRGRLIKTMGDGFLTTFDATTPAVRCAHEIVKQATELGLELRVGVHSGEVEVRDDDVAGLAVTIGKRICDLAGPGQVLVSETVKEHIVGSGIAVSEQGTHVLKGVPDTWKLFGVEA
jgi:class 3 adenylate cyclase